MHMHVCKQTTTHRGLLWEWPESKCIWASIPYLKPAEAGLK